DFGRLRAGDDALGLEQPGGADLVKGFGVASGQGHGGLPFVRGGVGEEGRPACLPARAPRRIMATRPSTSTPTTPPSRTGAGIVRSSSARPCRTGLIPSGRSPSGTRRPAAGG